MKLIDPAFADFDEVLRGPLKILLERKIHGEPSVGWLNARERLNNNLRRGGTQRPCVHIQENHTTNCVTTNRDSECDMAKALRI